MEKGSETRKYARLPGLTIPQSSSVISVRIPSAHPVFLSLIVFYLSLSLSLSFFLRFPLPFFSSLFLSFLPLPLFILLFSTFRQTCSSVFILDAPGSGYFARKKHLSPFIRNYHFIGFFFYFIGKAVIVVGGGILRCVDWILKFDSTDDNNKARE